MSGSMLGLISLGPQGDAEAQERRAELVPGSASEVLGAALSEGFQESIGPRLGRVVSRGYVDQGDGTYAPLNAFDENEQPTGLLPPSPMVPLDTLKREYEIPGVLSFDKDTPQSVAQSLYDHKRDQMARQDAIRRADNMLTQGMAARFAASMVGSLADPVNIAAMFVPGLNEAAVARMAGVAAGAGAMARAGVRAGAGATQGAAGMLALEPLNYLLMGQERDDWTMAGALANVLFGTVAGAGFHSGLGALAERSRGLPDWAPARLANERLQSAPPEVQEAVARAAVAATVEGRPVEAASLLELHEALATEYRGSLSLGHARNVGDGPLEAFTRPDQVADRFDESGGTFGADGVYLDNAGTWTSDHYTQMGARENYRVEAPFEKAYVISPDTIDDLVRRFGATEAEMAELRAAMKAVDYEDGRPVSGKEATPEDWARLEKAQAAVITGERIAAKLKEEGYDGVIVQGFDEIEGTPRGAEVGSKVDQAGIVGEVLQDQVFHFFPERVGVKGRMDGAAARVMVEPTRPPAEIMQAMETARAPDPRAAEPPAPVSRTPLPPPDPEPPGDGAVAKDIAEIEKQVGALDALIKMQEGPAPLDRARSNRPPGSGQFTTTVEMTRGDRTEQVRVSGDTKDLAPRDAEPTMADRLKEFDALVDEEVKVDRALFEAAAACIVRAR